MIAFLDTSVILRMLLSEPGKLKEWPTLEQVYISRLLPLEVRRVTDRYRLMQKLQDLDVATLHEELSKILRSFEIVTLTEDILDRAAGPMPTVLGSLDAIHLASALEVKRRLAPELIFATHDLQLAIAARASGFSVRGV